LEEEEEEEDVVEVEELGFWQMNSFWDIFIAQVPPTQKKKKGSCATTNPTMVLDRSSYFIYNRLQLWNFKNI
jgi:hypothetical protein